MWATATGFFTSDPSTITKMNKVECKNFSEPDEVRGFPKGRLELLKIGGATVGRATY